MLRETVLGSVTALAIASTLVVAPSPAAAFGWHHGTRVGWFGWNAPMWSTYAYAPAVAPAPVIQTYANVAPVAVAPAPVISTYEPMGPVAIAAAMAMQTYAM